MEDQDLLQLQQIALYLPYNLKWYYTGVDEDNGRVLSMSNLSKGCKVSLITENNTFTIQNFDTLNFEFIPILLPLSELENDKNFWEEFYMEYGGGFNNITNFKNTWNTQVTSDPLGLDYNRLQLLVKRYYDVFGLIEKGLGKNILELEKELSK